MTNIEIEGTVSTMTSTVKLISEIRKIADPGSFAYCVDGMLKFTKYEVDITWSDSVYANAHNDSDIGLAVKLFLIGITKECTDNENEIMGKIIHVFSTMTLRQIVESVFMSSSFLKPLVVKIQLDPMKYIQYNHESDTLYNEDIPIIRAYAKVCMEY